MKRFFPLSLIILLFSCEEQKPENEAPILENTVTDIDGNIYQTVQIGSQTWMAENLKTTRYADGSAIPFVTSGRLWNALDITGRAYCWYDNDIINKDIFGGLYTWEAAMKGEMVSDLNTSGVQGACPDGWHLPSDTEWDMLIDYLGGPNNAGGKMKESGTIHWNSPNGGATNESGFTALPVGLRDYTDVDSLFHFNGKFAIFWSSTEDRENSCWVRNLRYEDPTVRRLGGYKLYGYSVRCVQDK